MANHIHLVMNVGTGGGILNEGVEHSFIQLGITEIGKQEQNRNVVPTVISGGERSGVEVLGLKKHNIEALIFVV